MRNERLKIQKIFIPQTFLTDIIDALSPNPKFKLEIMNPLPKDARIIAIYSDPIGITLIVESDSFKEVCKSEEIPPYYFTLTKSPVNQNV